MAENEEFCLECNHVKVKADTGKWPSLALEFQLPAQNGYSDYKVNIRVADFPTVLEAMAIAMRAEVANWT